MCVAAADLYGACLEDWSADWASAGYADRDDFLDGCQTWAWEMSLLEEDAVEGGLAGAEGATARACTERERSMTAEDAVCEDYTGVDWNERPWE